MFSKFGRPIVIAIVFSAVASVSIWQGTIPSEAADAPVSAKERVIKMLVDKRRWRLKGEKTSGTRYHEIKLNVVFTLKDGGLSVAPRKGMHDPSATVGDDGTVTLKHGRGGCRKYEWTLEPSGDGSFEGVGEGDNRDCTDTYRYAAKFVARKTLRRPSASGNASPGILVKRDRNIRKGRVKKTYWIDADQGEGVVELDFELANPPTKTPSEVTLVLQVARVKHAGSKHGIAVYSGDDELAIVERVRKGKLLKIPLKPERIKWGRNLTLTLRALGKNATGILPKSSGEGARLLIKN